MQKKISVIMGIYNCSNTLGEAIESIIAQTYEGWELILCDDGSTDDTFEQAQRYVDKYPEKIFLFQNDKNMGLNYTLNKCLENATGDYIARMDGDDICSPDRFEKELKAFEEHPDITIVSTDMNFFDESGVWGRTHEKNFPVNEDLVRKTPFCHAPCMVRREAYLAVDGYSVDKKLLRVEDYHLWIKMYMAGFKGMNLSEPLYSMRDDRNAYSRRKFKYRLNEAYVKTVAIRKLDLPIYNYLYCLKPILVGLLPNKIYDLLHKMTKNGV